MHTIRPNAAGAQRLIILFIINIVLTVLYLVALGFQYWLLDHYIQNFDNYDEQVATLNDTIQQYFLVGWSIVNLVLIVVFIQWFRRAYFNLRQIPAIQTSYTDGWAAGAWFIPVMNLVRPYTIMKEIWIGTQHAVSHRLTGIAQPTLVGVWWGIYIVNLLSGRIFDRFGDEETFAGLLTITQFSIIAFLLTLASAIICLVMVKRINKFENELWKEAQTPSDSVFSLMPEAGQSISS